MKAVRRLLSALAVIAAVISPVAQAGATPTDPAPTGSAPTRIDTDATGNPDPAGGAYFQGISGNGRYAMILARSNSTLVPKPHRTTGYVGSYLLRKDLVSGAVILAGVWFDGTPVRVSWSASAINHDGTRFAYVGIAADGFAALYYRNLSATSAVRKFPFTPDSWSAWNLALSSDDRWLSWMSSDNLGRTHLNRTEVDNGQTTELPICKDRTNGCDLTGGPSVSADGTKFVFRHRPDYSTPDVATFFDTASGQLRVLPEGTQLGGHTISGDGSWILYSTRTDCCAQLKKIATTPGSTPIPLRAWDHDGTTSLYPTSTDRTGNVVGYVRETADPGKYVGARRAYVHDQSTGTDTALPEPRPDLAYVAWPTITSDARVAVVREECLRGVSCEPTGTYTVRLSGP